MELRRKKSISKMEKVMLTHLLKIKKRNHDAKKTTALSHTPELLMLKKAARH